MVSWIQHMLFFCNCQHLAGVMFSCSCKSAAAMYDHHLAFVVAIANLTACTVATWIRTGQRIGMYLLHFAR